MGAVLASLRRVLGLLVLFFGVLATFLAIAFAAFAYLDPRWTLDNRAIAASAIAAPVFVACGGLLVRSRTAALNALVAGISLPALSFGWLLLVASVGKRSPTQGVIAMLLLALGVAGGLLCRRLWRADFTPPGATPRRAPAPRR